MQNQLAIHKHTACVHRRDRGANPYPRVEAGGLSVTGEKKGRDTLLRIPSFLVQITYIIPGTPSFLLRITASKPCTPYPGHPLFLSESPKEYPGHPTRDILILGHAD